MKTLSIILLLLITSSCATKRTSKIYAGIAGAFIAGSIGAIIGKEASPNSESQMLNGVMGGTLGVTAGAFLGAYAGGYFYGEDPENKELKQMIRKQAPLIDIPLDGSSGINLNIKTHGVANGKSALPMTNIPENILKNMKKPIVIEHVVGEKILNYEGNKTIIIPEFKYFEQTYEE